ncbi:MAG: carbohydrate ABC transporter permease [Ruminiclostridium sp.]|nr:carbohydrate ABC transporter permease [Ruminiclostridium sp.]
MPSRMEYIDKGNKTSLFISRLLSYIFLVFVTILSLFSFYLLIINSSRSNAQLQAGFEILPKEHFFDNLVTAWNDQSIFFLPQGMLNSFIVAAFTCILTSYFSAMTAYGVCVYDFKGRNLVHKAIILVMMIPTQVSALGFVQLVNSLHLTNTYWPLIIPAIAAPATYFYMKQYIDSTLPLEIVEAARVDGSNEFRTYNFICLPILKPALAVQMIFAFVASWNNFFTPALILDKKEMYTLPIMLSIVRSRINSQSGDMGEVYMIILLAIVPVVIVYLFLSKFIIGGVTLGSVKG